MTAGDMDADNAAKGLLVNIELPQCWPGIVARARQSEAVGSIQGR
jgi:hypothetical protein